MHKQETIQQIQSNKWAKEQYHQAECEYSKQGGWALHKYIYYEHH